MCSSQVADAELVAAARAGDAAGFGELVRRYQGLIYGLAYHQVGNFADAQDIAQNAFVKAFRRLDQLEQPECFSAWLKTIAANECKTWIRASRSAIPLEDAETRPSYASLSANKWRQHERQTEVRRAVASLPERSRLMVDLHYLSGLSHREIGEFLGVRANAVAQHLYRARQQLKQMLMPEIEEGYAMNKLPESFTEDVLGRITLYPVEEGKFMVCDGDGDARGMTMAVEGVGPEKSYITLWMRQDDLDDVVLGTLPRRTAEKAKGRALNSALELLNALGIELKQVEIRLSGDRKCRAAVRLAQDNTETTVDMRPSDALGLAVRVKAPVYVEEPVVRRGNVGEDDLPTPDSDMDPDTHNEEYEKFRWHDRLVDKVFEMGVSTEDCIDTVRFRKDEANGVLRVWLEAVPEKEATFDLMEYGPGVEMIFDLGGRRGATGRLCEGDPVRGFRRRYKLLYSLLGGDARVRVILEAPDAQEGE
ncbi:MAG: DUF151 domain-containing protein [Armatimonadota bacterium]|nr:DUF151 domain-containing protein [Armatimonadota bacterium]